MNQDTESVGLKLDFSPPPVNCQDVYQRLMQMAVEVCCIPLYCFDINQQMVSTNKKPISKKVVVKRVRFLRFRVDHCWLALRCYGIWNDPNAYGHQLWRAYEDAQHALSSALHRYGKDHPEVYEPL